MYSPKCFNPLTVIACRPTCRLPLQMWAVLSPSSGIYYGQLDLDPALADESDHLIRHHLLPAGAMQPPQAQAGTPTAGEPPLSLVRVAGAAECLLGGGGAAGAPAPLSLMLPQVATCFPRERSFEVIMGKQQASCQAERSLTPLPHHPQAFTQWHFVVLYGSKVQYINHVSKQVVQEVALDRWGWRMQGGEGRPGLVGEAIS